MTQYNPINQILQFLNLAGDSQATDALHELFDAIFAQAEAAATDERAMDELEKLEEAMHGSISKTAWDAYTDFSLLFAERHATLMTAMYAHGFTAALKSGDKELPLSAPYQSHTTLTNDLINPQYSDDLQQRHAAFQEHVNFEGRAVEELYWEALKQFYYQAELAAFHRGADAGRKLHQFIATF